MEDEILSQITSEPAKAIATIRSTTKSTENIQNYIKEYSKSDRSIRDTQVGKVQVDKPIKKDDGNSDIVKVVKIPVNFSKKIVRTSVAFEVGKPSTLIPSVQNGLSDLIKLIWKTNRLDSAIQKLIHLKKSQTQGAIQFYINDIKENSLFLKALIFLNLKSQAKEIKSKVLDNTQGVMTPYFDSTGDMILFMWEYKTKVGTKDVNNVQIWDKENFYHFSDANGSMAFVEGSPTKHGFDRIPIVYVSQDEPEWFDVKEMIDRFEVSFSKLGDSNDYSAYPILQIFGEVKSLPDKNQNGKIIQFPVKPKIDGEVNPFPHGKAEFLESKGAAVSQKLELEKLEDLIHSISSTPNLSFDNVKGISGISGIALKLMFLDAMIKASTNEGENRTMYERMLNIIISGITLTTNTALAKDAASLYYEVQFNSILPDDLKEAVEIVSSAIESGVMSKKTGVEYLGMNEDVEEELALIESDKKAVEVLPT